MAHRELLRTHRFAAGLSEHQLERLAAFAEPVTFSDGEVILGHNRPSSACYLVLEGSVAVELATPYFTVCVQAVGAGEMFGWSAILDHQKTLFQVRAREDVEALRLDGETLAAASREDPQLGQELYSRMLQVAANRLSATEEKVAELCGVRIAS